MGEYLEFRGGIQYPGGYHDARGGIKSTVGDIMMHVSGYHDARGGYHDARERIS